LSFAHITRRFANQTASRSPSKRTEISCQDPTSRDELYQALADLRALFRDWWFGQLVANLATASGATDHASIWDLEDEQLLNAARRLIERNGARDPVRS
jgi:hypothetical protein